jgi:hypothetical protein
LFNRRIHILGHVNGHFPDPGFLISEYGSQHTDIVADVCASNGSLQASPAPFAILVGEEIPYSALGYLPPTIYLSEHGKLPVFPTLQMDNEIDTKYQITTVVI